MAAIVRKISRFFPIAVLMLVLAADVAHAQTSHELPAHSPAQIIGLLPAVLLIGAGAYLAYRRSRPTN